MCPCTGSTRNFAPYNYKEEFSSFITLSQCLLVTQLWVFFLNLIIWVTIKPMGPVKRTKVPGSKDYHLLLELTEVRGWEIREFLIVHPSPSKVVTYIMSVQDCMHIITVCMICMIIGMCPCTVLPAIGLCYWLTVYCLWHMPMWILHNYRYICVTLQFSIVGLQFRSHRTQKSLSL